MKDYIIYCCATPLTVAYGGYGVWCHTSPLILAFRVCSILGEGIIWITKYSSKGHFCETCQRRVRRIRYIRGFSLGLSRYLFKRIGVRCCLWSRIIPAQVRCKAMPGITVLTIRNTGARLNVKCRPNSDCSDQNDESLRGHCTNERRVWFNFF